MKLVLESAHDLDRAQRLVSWLNRPAVDQVLISLPCLESEHRQRLAGAIKSYFNDCGCLWGTPAFVLVLVVCFWTRPWGDASRWVGSASSLVASVLGAVVAKLAALAWSRWRLKALLGRVTQLETRSTPWL